MGLEIVLVSNMRLRMLLRILSLLHKNCNCVGLIISEVSIDDKDTTYLSEWQWCTHVPEQKIRGAKKR